MTHTLMQVYEAALLARGERKLDSLARCNVWTRSYRVTRATDGTLMPAQKVLHFFIGTAGSVRIGRIRSESKPLADDYKAMLLVEGREAIKAVKEQKPSLSIGLPDPDTAKE